jgi:hypothetical protein
VPWTHVLPHWFAWNESTKEGKREMRECCHIGSMCRRHLLLPSNGHGHRSGSGPWLSEMKGGQKETAATAMASARRGTGESTEAR